MRPVRGRPLSPRSGRPARLLAILFLVTCSLTLPAPGTAWSEATRRDLALRTRALAPPDLARQLHRHEVEWFAAMREGAPPASLAPDRAGSALAAAVDAVVEAIRGHRPMSEVTRRMGTLAVLAMELNDPLQPLAPDPHARRLAPDFQRYVDSARGRFAPVFYGLDGTLARRGGVERLAGSALGRSATLRTAIAREYERIGQRSGRDAFDDRSTAFAVGAIAYSRALTDAVQLARHAWLRAGGGDRPGRLPASGGPLLRLAPPRRAP